MQREWKNIPRLELTMQTIALADTGGPDCSIIAPGRRACVGAGMACLVTYGGRARRAATGAGEGARMTSPVDA